MADISTKPYLIRAIHEWCEDSGYRPYIAVVVDERTQVPQEFVRNGEIVLNVSAQATHRLRIGNDFVEFEARFSGAVRSVSIPIDNVSAIYAQETGHGMAFDVVRVQAQKPPSASPPRPVPSVAPPASTAQAAPKPVEPARSSPERAAKPRLVPKPVEAAADSDDRVEGAVQDGAASAAPAATPTRKPRSPRRRAQTSDSADVKAKSESAVSAGPSEPKSESAVSAGPSETKTESAVSAAPFEPKATSDAAPTETAAPSAGGPAAPPKPARGHLKRVK